MGLSHSPSIVTSGLILYLDAANKKSYPGTGTVWYDLSGNGNHGTLVNGVGYSTDNKGSMVFDGVDDYINCGTGSSVADLTYTSSSTTISAWIKNTSSRIIAGKSDRNNSAGWVFGVSNNIPVFTNIFGAGNARYSASSSVILNRWCEVAVTHISSTGACKFYIDGLFINESIEKGSGKTTDITYPLFIGYNIYTDRSSNFFNGLLPIIKIYNRALSAAEIQQNFNALKGRYEI